MPSTDLFETPAAAKNIASHTAGLKAGWYVLDGGFFWHDLPPNPVAGPFTTQADAMAARTAIERTRGNAGRYWIDSVDA
ncbi:hypothetical protein SEA_PHABULOSO_45 [Gordonia phage Phabuloso]|nr:hypothetical protein SEA_PHABULOSO_45 [Gordonia phage Phabuloso]